jgi:hypothetical protein
MFSYAKCHRFKRALAAAAHGPEALDAELSKPGADANVKSEREYGDSLLFAIVTTIPDEKLPALLLILKNHQVNFYVIDINDNIFSTAGYYCRSRALDFLLSLTPPADVDFNKLDILQSVIRSFETEEIKLSLLKHLIEVKKLNVNGVTNAESLTALMRAAQCEDFSHAKILAYLIDQHADLFHQAHYQCGIQMTALRRAFQVYCEAERYTENKNDPHLLEKKTCLEALLAYARACLTLFIDTFAGTNAQLQIEFKNRVKNLIGTYGRLLMEQSMECHIAIMKEEDKAINELVLDQILRPVLLKEKLAFLTATKGNQSSQVTLNFFGSDMFDRNLVSEIFAYFPPDRVDIKQFYRM